ncbi:hypothetical protein [Pseudomonas sp. 5P_3.1_Bac2]|uniref:hypothetical protein n=1 Tax=Pseudomonas sp. 5P_3.1_Bac2 TaxID=2971617 RepID=UPI0021C7A5C5|nr:hypothetical protein [Pseudomonas sp. 5P_3.1_Bac2]MCU1716573.1 hypothetical protein [Pseudomonas sp. 5P_3.1_Bac2]
MSSRLLAIVFSTLLAALVPLSANAAPAPQAAENLLKLHQMRLAAQKSLGDFYMFNSMEADQRYARMIHDDLEQANAQLSALHPMPGQTSTAMHEQILQLWQDYQVQLNKLTDAITQQGYSDLQPVADLAVANQKLMGLSAQLYSAIQQDAHFSVPPLTQRSREQSLLMQGIAVDYASRSASVGATFIGGTDARPIEELVSQFAGQMQALLKEPQNTAPIKQSWNEVSTKWRYIENSLINYNEKTVPFLVNKYSTSIIQNIELIASQYAAANL